MLLSSVHPWGAKSLALPHSLQPRPLTVSQRPEGLQGIARGFAQQSDPKMAPRHILLFDVMDTVVKDPFFTHCPQALGMTLKELFAVKHPKTWMRFERGEIKEGEMYKNFFTDGRDFDGPAMKAQMVGAYAYVEGMEGLLTRLAAANIEMHAMSNYPLWYQDLDTRLHLSRLLPWTFVSCSGPMQGQRKPDPAAFAAVTARLHAGASSQLDLTLIDDRLPNVEAAEAAGWRAIHFQGAQQLEQELQRLDLPAF